MREQDAAHFQAKADALRFVAKIVPEAAGLVEDKELALPAALRRGVFGL